MTNLIRTHEIPELDTAGLRKFGLSTGAIVGILFGLGLPFLFGLDFPRWPWVIAVVLIAWALVAPASLKHVYLNWMRLGLVLNRIVSPIVLGIVFFLVVTPIGLIMRIAGRDPMGQVKRPEDESCRVKSKSRDAKHLENPY